MHVKFKNKKRQKVLFDKKKSNFHTRENPDKVDSGMNPVGDKEDFVDVVSDKTISDLEYSNKYSVLSLEENDDIDADLSNVNNVEVVDKEDFNKSLIEDVDFQNVQILDKAPNDWSLVVNRWDNSDGLIADQAIQITKSVQNSKVDFKEA
ncbi:hypothetical protein MA16_Dca001569 [Dendrobium catenatum]|uniref:Uncharacterized protein n=1 Tax=Dendrobium catenatum TaxID=906689 RepID=A0A2I0WMT3_9ASPA|nr:hypothetical protein MA16_Dca001569 [Dendrobium catenatum]